MEREYIVTCKTREDLESLYDDLETPGGSLHIPDRAVECLNKRFISRNTHYSLTDEEAALVKQDERVLDVELTPEELGIEFHPSVVIESSEAIEEEEGVDISNDPNYTQSSNRWSKSSNNSDIFRNWGLLRSLNGATFNNWGYDGSFNVSTTRVRVTSQGENVDVVIVDGRIDPNHPEFALNEDGSGGTRVVQYNWLQDTPNVTGGAAGNYSYTPYIGSTDLETGNNNHGCHVAGTAAGNRRGWARKANIYNIDLYSTDPNNIGTSLVFDYIRYWHNNKPINPDTGKRNPTVCNNSWGSSYAGAPISNITSIVYRGTTYNGPFTAADCNDYGILNDGTNVNGVPALTTSFKADMIDAMNDGVIMVAAAGNNYFYSDVEGGINYDNRFVYSGNTRYYHRGSQPGAIPGVISVGNASALVNESKRTDSTVGPRVDLYASGDRIISSLHSNQMTNGTVGVATDSRNGTNEDYVIGKLGGTSMASPQVAGSIACLLEHWPRATHEEIREWLVKYGTTEDQMTDTGRTARNYSVTNSGNNYVFSGDATGTQPDITVQEGNILTFSLNVASNHPFYIVTALGGNNSTNEVSEGFLTVGASRTQGDMRWDTRGVTPGTYYYVCDVHGGMNGEIRIESDHLDYTSLQDNSFTDVTLNIDNGNRYLFHPNQRRVPDPTGATYIGGSTNSEVCQPRGQHKFKNYDVGQDAILFPRKDTWFR